MNISFLGFFKYFNFVAESFDQQPASFNLKAHPVILNIIPPAREPFNNSHGLSFVFDVNTRKTGPITNFIDYSPWVSFFPLLNNFNKTRPLPDGRFSDESHLTQKSINAFDNKLMETSEEKSWRILARILPMRSVLPQAQVSLLSFL